MLTVEFVELVSLTCPPTPRTQTPPPCWSGAGLGGAPTNALLCNKKAEFAAKMVEPSIPDIAAEDAPREPKFCTTLLDANVQFAAWAPEPAANDAAKVKVIVCNDRRRTLRRMCAPPVKN